MGIHWDIPLNINLNINNENQDCKIGTVCVGGEGGTSGKEEGEGKRLRWWYMIYELHIPIWNRAKKPFAIALSGVGRRAEGRDNGRNVNNVQYKSNWNCHYEYSLYNEYILLKFI
jgi:hypothetical protein